MSGFALTHRAVFDHPLFDGDAQRLGAWLWLVGKACWKPTPFIVSGKTITLERGQLCVSRTQLSKAWGMSPSAVERFLARLETEQMIGRATGQGRSVITICNYALYQDLASASGQETGQVTGQAADSDRTTKEQGNKGTRLEDTDVSSFPVSPPAEKPKARRAVALPQDFTPALTLRAQAIVDGWPPGKFDAELRRFKDHAADKGRTSKDWQAALRTWIEKADEWMKQNGHTNRTSQSSDDRRDGLSRGIDRWANLGDVEGAAEQSDGRAVRPSEGHRQGALALPGPADG